MDTIMKIIFNDICKDSRINQEVTISYSTNYTLDRGTVCFDHFGNGSHYRCDISFIVLEDLRDSKDLNHISEFAKCIIDQAPDWIRE